MDSDEDIPLDPSTLIRLGVVTQVTMNPPRCRVRFGDPDADDGDVETPPIRWLAMRAGKTRKWSPPDEGEEVVLLTPDGQIGNAVALLGLNNDNAPPPGSTTGDLTEYEDGARISYDPATHALNAELPDGATALIRAATITLDGNVHVTGTLSADTDVTAAGISLKGHRHAGIQRGGGTTDPPAA
ncbi:phage baseplate assembly protein V [Novosphingobium sp. FSY-8]|uniref:Phage baseplate assembly protein V n=1 Tax=Novosphingobium ovatum TaxID=1908523 RepID=A0ABW9XAH7_9SPHN|nr:phage baseplate assembly protein V [Novosphingobium ovatum]NBC35539.1 phage baseplate assembly protein V [Novosphingobium ovatum]